MNWKTEQKVLRTTGIITGILGTVAIFFMFASDVTDTFDALMAAAIAIAIGVVIGMIGAMFAGLVTTTIIHKSLQ